MGKYEREDWMKKHILASNGNVSYKDMLFFLQGSIRS